jgi:hypothetical protein
MAKPPATLQQIRASRLRVKIGGETHRDSRRFHFFFWNFIGSRDEFMVKESND